MKRTLVLIIIIAVCVAGFLSIRGVMPFMAVYGISMEPELQAGDLILIEEVAPSEIKVGDIIVFTIPSAVREYYNYPPIVAHRVLDVRESEKGVTFRTKGDNTGEDPFTVRPQDIRGQVSQQISYLGLPLLFFQSQQGLIFIIIALSLLAFYLYAGEISHGREWAHQVIFAPVIKESQRTNQMMEQRLESTNQGMEFTQQALNSFATAMSEYAKHLQSHTSAIQGLSEASHELKKGAAEQNHVLARLLATVEQPSPKPQLAEPTPEVEERKLPPVAPTPAVEECKFPPGCFKSRQGDTKKELKRTEPLPSSAP